MLGCIRRARVAYRVLQQADDAGDRELVEVAHAAVERKLFVIGEAAKDLTCRTRSGCPSTQVRGRFSSPASLRTAASSDSIATAAITRRSPYRF